MNELDPTVARRIIDTVGANGIPPQYGFQSFTAGLEPYLSVIDDEYLSSFIKQGGSAFKMVVGVYGGGKTHFLYCIRDLAWKHNFVVSYVSLSPSESPFHRLELVYSALVRGIVAPLSPEELLSGYEQGMVSFLRTWFSQNYQECRKKGRFGVAYHVRENCQSPKVRTRCSEAITQQRLRALCEVPRRDDPMGAH
jgi:hypothetical protein